MKRSVLRLVCLLLCLLQFTVLFAACKKEPEEKPTETTDNTQKGDGTVDENGYELDSINRTLGGKEVNILTYTTSKDYLAPEQHTNGANYITDEVYMRNLELEARLGCTFNFVYVNGEWNDRTTFVSAAEKSGDSNYDIICSYSLWPSLLVVRGLLTNLKNLEYPELSKPWWPDSLSNYEVEGALYYVSNNSSIETVRSLSVMLVQNKMLEKRGLESLEDDVLDGTWTMDKMISYALMVDTNMDLPVSEREFGLVSWGETGIDYMYYGAGLEMVVKDANDKHVLMPETQTHKERVLTFISKLSPLCTTERFDMPRNSDVLNSARAMFYVASMEDVQTLEDGNIYSVYPLPKLDETQKEYRTISHNSYDTWCIPTTAANREDSALVIEGFASSDYRTLAPLYYENRLKIRYSKDEIGAEIFDIVRHSAYLDFGRIASATLGVMEVPIRSCFWYEEEVQCTDRYITQLGENINMYKTSLKSILKYYEMYSDR